ncbi:uncharacterized protein LOC117652614 [Thrips palmi]|uniref:Uncharacterized protein LOC117652614 n=1 Tax=Thrips palmi TaxID=161013 RepID=A0A6P9AC72_THRPL|nr:uncharacterized protein LOC117652614 [Thrips palmi]
MHYNYSVGTHCGPGDRRTSGVPFVRSMDGPSDQSIAQGRAAAATPLQVQEQLPTVQVDGILEALACAKAAGCTPRRPSCCNACSNHPGDETSGSPTSSPSWVSSSSWRV